MIASPRRPSAQQKTKKEMRRVTYASAIGAAEDLREPRLFGRRERCWRPGCRMAGGTVATCKHEDTEGADQQDGERGGRGGGKNTKIPKAPISKTASGRSHNSAVCNENRGLSSTNSP